jgi:hypothetical protein
MSNHGNESTNKEGVNIDETQAKIDMGKLITPLQFSLFQVDFGVGIIWTHCLTRHWEQGILDMEILLLFLLLR